jgi:hypothetical protein
MGEQAAHVLHPRAVRLFIQCLVVEGGSRRWQAAPPWTIRPAPSKPSGRSRNNFGRLLRTGSLEEAVAAKAGLEDLVTAAARPETNRRYRIV